MKWVTRSHVHVDRVACPWLITRFIDSDAEFLFVPKSEIERVVKETGAIPFDAPGVELGHHEGDGASPGRCSFESIILKYGLSEPGLLRLAKIVHARRHCRRYRLGPAWAWIRSHRQRVQPALPGRPGKSGAPI